MKEWKILEYGSSKPSSTRMIEYECEKCEEESLLPVAGLVMAQLGMGLVFDIGDRWMPERIRCPYCGSTYEGGNDGLR